MLVVGCCSADTLLVKSINAGRVWSDADPGPPYIEMCDVVSSGRIYLEAGTAEGRAFLTSSDGSGWTGLPVLRGIASLVDTWNASPLFPDIVYFHLTDGTILKTTDGGRTGLRYPALHLPTVNHLEDASATLSVFVLGPSSLWAKLIFQHNVVVLLKSEDEGRTWMQWNVDLGSCPACQQLWVLPQPGSPQPVIIRRYVYSQTPDQKDWDVLQRSEDLGATWTPLTIPGCSLDIFARHTLEQDAKKPSTLYVECTWDGLSTAFYRSDDAGKNWRPLASLNAQVSRLYVSPADASNLWAYDVDPFDVIRRTNPWRSTDGGRTWSQTSNPLRGYLVLDPKDPDTVYTWLERRQQAHLYDRQTFSQNVAGLSGAGALAPGSLVSIYGSDLAGGTALAGAGPLPASLLGVAVRFGGRPAPLLFVSPGQINAQVPFGLDAGPVFIEVQRNDGSVDRQVVDLMPQAPAILRSGDWPQIFHSDAMRLVTTADPVRSQETIVIRCAGLGETKPGLQAGAVAPDPPATAQPPVVAFLSRAPEESGFIGEQNSALRAVAVPGMVGVYDVSVRVPSLTALKNFTIYVQVGALDSAAIPAVP